MCSTIDAEFSSFDFNKLKNYAVNFRYPDDEYNPNISEAEEHLMLARKVKTFVEQKINLK